MSKDTLLQEPTTDWNRVAKGLLMAAVAVATVLETQEVPDWLKIASRCTVGIGAMFGIASGGFAKR
jgi:hypothetical protein